MKKKLSPPSYLTDCFLSSYFFADILLNRHLEHDVMRDIYNKYAAIFHIHDTEKTDEYWTILMDDLFALADSPRSFHRLARLAKQYPDSLTNTEHYLLTHKGTAMARYEQLFPEDRDKTADTVLDIIEKKADGGHIECIALYGFLEYYGICLDTDSEAALRRIDKAASWNDLFAVLMSDAFGFEREKQHARLLALLDGAVGRESLHYLSKELGIKPSTVSDSIASALARAFCYEAITADRLNPDIDRLIDSTILSEDAKCRLLRSIHSPESIPVGIPLDITGQTAPTPELDRFKSPYEHRKSEYELLFGNLSMLDLRRTDLYKPLLILCRNDFVYDRYRTLLMKGFGNHPTASISFADGETPDLSSTKDNCLLAAMDRLRDRNSILILECCEELSPECAADLARFLPAKNRSKLRLASIPPAEVDMSGMLPILLSKKLPPLSVAQHCDIVTAAEPTPEEFRSLLAEKLSEISKLFGFDTIEIENDAAQFLFDYSSRDAMLLVNKTVAMHRGGKSKLKLTRTDLEHILSIHFTPTGNNGFWRNTAK